MAKIAAESEKTKLKDNDIRIPYRYEDKDIASFPGQAGSGVD